ncbi:transcription termination/antitermination protein NusG [Spiroplasma endosymbiont of Crioceris asparagi]|uniref:transcription termination/antitermination protein NusG n=1 Tax=Spiroplasma endosymbiont of Crioceris asparagi TaxID=3066286 RepID=UPI0030CC43B7
MRIEDLELFEELDSYKGQWFVINCNSGHEDKVRADLLQKIETSNLGDWIFDIKISKVNVLNKNKKTVSKNMFPGYLFINMIMNNDTWFIIRNTPGVTGFIGSSGKGAKPFPITTEEIMRMLGFENKDEKLNLNQKEVSGSSVIKKEKVVYETNLKKGSRALIKSGPFTDMDGNVLELDFEKGIAIIEIEMFGRATPYEVEFKNLELIK